jgi:hypothetical protein
MEQRVPDVDELVMMSPSAIEIAGQQLDFLYRTTVAATALMLQRVEASGVFHLDDHRNVAAWGRSTNNWSNAEASRMVKLAHAMQVMPGFAAACLAGRIGVPQMHAIAAVAANPRVREHPAGADELFVTSAEELAFDDLVVFLRHWEELADIEGARSRHDRAVRDRRASVSFVGERAYLEAQGPAHDGVLFEEVLHRFMELEWQLEWEMLSAIHGDEMHAGLMERTPQQRGFDALHRVFSAAAGSQEAGAMPTINLVIDQETFEHELARMADEAPEPLDPNAHAARRRCEDADGRVLDPHAITAMALSAHVRRVVVGADGVVLNMGLRQRLFTGPAREAVLMAHRRCTRVGCNIPGSRCEADHLVPFAHDGPTDVANGGPHCDPHNRGRNKGFRTVRDALGRYHTLRADGAEIGWPTYRFHMRFMGLVRDLELFDQ